MADVDGGDILIRIRGDASELEAEIGRAQGALGDLEGGADDTSSSLSSMGKTAGQLNTALKGMNRGGINAVAAGLSMVNPQAARLVRTLGAMRLLTGPLAIALGVLAAAFAAYKHEVDKAAEAAEQAQERIESFNDAFDTQAVIAEDLRNELRLIQGEIDKDGLAHEKRKTRIQAAGDAVVAAIDEQIEAQQKLIDEQEQERRVSVEQQAQVEALKQEMALLTQERRDAIEATESQIDAAEAIAEFNRELAASEEFLADKTRQRAAADREAAEAAKERAAANRQSIDALIADLNTVSAETGVAIDQTVAQLDAALNEVEMLALQDQEAIKGGIIESLGAVASLSSTLSDQMAEDNKKTALALFRTSQAAGLVQVAINTQVAISKALAQLGPVAGPVAAVGLGLAGAAQAAVIAAQPPPAHMGDPLAPDERRVSGRRVLATETVLDSATTRRMGGEDGLREAMRGGGGSQPVQVNLTYKHLDREIARLMRSNSRTRRAVRS